MTRMPCMQRPTCSWLWCLYWMMWLQVLLMRTGCLIARDMPCCAPEPDHIYDGVNTALADSIADQDWRMVLHEIYIVTQA